MKKLMLLLLAVFTLAFTACEKENYDPYYAEDGEEWTDNNDDNGNEESDEEGALTLYSVSGGNITKVRDYDVPARLKSYQEDEARHQEIWEFFTRLIPAEARTKIVEFEILFGDNDLGGYVVPIDESDLSRWKMGLAIEIAGDLTTIDFNEEYTQIVVHELAHVLTLDDTQVNVGGDENSCGEFFTGEGCSKSGSYINRFFDLAWADIYANHNPDRPEKTYDRYTDRFVTEYAATNPGEDIAETMAFFITEPNRRTGTTLADKKIQLLYEFPELVSLRESIRGNGEVNGLTQGVSLGKLNAKTHIHGKAHSH
jgi:hypothetical protein